jgi:hypothetical protein
VQALYRDRQTAVEPQIVCALRRRHAITRKVSICREFQATDGTRSHDLLHGKQTYIGRPERAFPCKLGLSAADRRKRDSPGFLTFRRVLSTNRQRVDAHPYRLGRRALGRACVYLVAESPSDGRPRRMGDPLRDPVLSRRCFSSGPTVSEASTERTRSTATVARPHESSSAPVLPPVPRLSAEAHGVPAAPQRARASAPSKPEATAARRVRAPATSPLPGMELDSAGDAACLAPKREQRWRQAQSG